VIHLRDRDGSEDAVAEAFATLAEQADGVPVILHCFSADPPWAERAAERGWYCSFAGNLTYPKAEPIREAAALVPDDRLLVETDSPFLAPQPMRGKPNQPANVVATAERLAEVREVAYGELERTVEANAARVFGW
jgi:TatD DNase family protein